VLRFLLVEAAQVRVRSNQEWRSKFFHLGMRRGRKIAKVARAGRLAIRRYWMWRKRWNYQQLTKFGSHSQARYQSAIDNLENGSFRLGRSVGSLIQNAPHVAVAFRGAMALGYFCTFFVSRACSNPGRELLG
jgi:hypothetical protein